MDPHHLRRLQEEQQKALYETDLKIHQLEQFKADYSALQDRLRTLPDKITHDVMVPFGKLAFMPGQMVHTNEILVLLGDNWFVERSAKQAGEIAGRRISELDMKLNDLHAQRKLLEPRLGFTSNLQAEMQGQGDVQEIVEEYDEEKEKLWDEKHRKNVRKHKEEVKQARATQREEPENKPDPLFSDSALWSRLDELEKIEEEKGEMEDMDSEEESDSQENSSTDVTPNSKRRVSWADLRKDEGGKEAEQDVHDKETDEVDEDNDDYNDTDETDNDSEDSANCGQPVTSKITFTHTPAPAVLPHQVCASGDDGIHSPADIYKLFSPKSILKKTSDVDNSPVVEFPSALNHPYATIDEDVIFAEDSDTDVGKPADIIPKPRAVEDAKTSSAQKAFTGLVVEKSVDDASSDTSLGAPSVVPSVAPSSSSSSLSTHDETSSPSPAAEPLKRVSRFKAARMKQNLS